MASSLAGKGNSIRSTLLVAHIRSSSFREFNFTVKSLKISSDPGAEQAQIPQFYRLVRNSVLNER